MKNKILLFIGCCLMLSGLASSCANDNYEEPQETFRGKFIDAATKEPFQTAIGNTGIRIRMMEYSWSDTPQPYDFNCKMDGTFNNNKIFEGEYGIKPSGAFVPLSEERIVINGTVEKVYEVTPILRLEWVGEPVVEADRSVTCQVKVSYGSTDPQYRKQPAEGWLYVSETNYVGDFSYSPNYSVKLAPTAAQVAQLMSTGEVTFTINTSASSKDFPNYARKYFIRAGVRTTVTFDNTNRYNYTTIKEVNIP